MDERRGGEGGGEVGRRRQLRGWVAIKTCKSSWRLFPLEMGGKAGPHFTTGRAGRAKRLATQQQATPHNLVHFCQHPHTLDLSCPLPHPSHNWK